MLLNVILPFFMAQNGQETAEQKSTKSWPLSRLPMMAVSEIQQNDAIIRMINLQFS